MMFKRKHTQDLQDFIEEVFRENALPFIKVEDREKFGMEPLAIRLKPEVAASDYKDPLFLSAVWHYIHIHRPLEFYRGATHEGVRTQYRKKIVDFFKTYTMEDFDSLDPQLIYDDSKVWHKILTTLHYYDYLYKALFPLWHLSRNGLAHDILQTKMAMDVLLKQQMRPILEGFDVYLFRLRYEGKIDAEEELTETPRLMEFYMKKEGLL